MIEKILNPILKLFGTKIIKEKGGNQMNAKFEIFKDRKKQWRFRLIATNSKIICASEGYTRRNNCLKGIRAVKRYANRAKIVEV